MPKSKGPQSGESNFIPRIEKLLTEQTATILDAVDAKLSAQDERMRQQFIAQEIRIIAAVDKRLAQMEERFDRKLERLTNTLDKFLKRMTDMEEEFAAMKADIDRVKAVLHEKLGVVLD